MVLANPTYLLNWWLAVHAGLGSSTDGLYFSLASTSTQHYYFYATTPYWVNRHRTYYGQRTDACTLNDRK